MFVQNQSSTIATLDIMLDASLNKSIPKSKIDSKYHIYIHLKFQVPYLRNCHQRSDELA